MYVSVSLPSNFASQWKLPPLLPSVKTRILHKALEGCSLSIVHSNQFLVGIFWRDRDKQEDDIIQSVLGISSLLQIIPVRARLAF